MKIYTGCYSNLLSGNLISISGDKGKKVGFVGNSYPKLAPKLSFWKIWEDNIDKISEEENTEFYIREYYNKVLKDLDPFKVVQELINLGENPILVCYEDKGFCHRYIVACWLEIKLKISVSEICIDKNYNVKEIKIQEKLINIITKVLLEEINK